MAGERNRGPPLAQHTGYAGGMAPGGKSAAKKRFPTLPTHPHVMLNHTDYETTYEGAPATRPKGVWPRAARGSPGCPLVPLVRAECPQALPHMRSPPDRASQCAPGEWVEPERP